MGFFPFVCDLLLLFLWPLSVFLFFAPWEIWSTQLQFGHNQNTTSGSTEMGCVDRQSGGPCLENDRLIQIDVDGFI